MAQRPASSLTFIFFSFVIVSTTAEIVNLQAPAPGPAANLFRHGHHGPKEGHHGPHAGHHHHRKAPAPMLAPSAAPAASPSPSPTPMKQKEVDHQIPTSIVKSIEDVVLSSPDAAKNLQDIITGTGSISADTIDKVKGAIPPSSKDVHAPSISDLINKVEDAYAIPPSSKDTVASAIPLLISSGGANDMLKGAAISPSTQDLLTSPGIGDLISATLETKSTDHASALPPSHHADTPSDKNTSDANGDHPLPLPPWLPLSSSASLCFNLR